MMNPPLIQKSSVAAAEIDQPEFADILQMNKRVSARHFRRLQYDRVGGGSSERATAFDRMPFAVSRFQPGTFLWGCAHAEACYQKVTVGAKCIPSRPASSKQCECEEAPRTRRSAFTFLSTSIMDIMPMRLTSTRAASRK